MALRIVILVQVRGSRTAGVSIKSGTRVGGNSWGDKTFYHSSMAIKASGRVGSCFRLASIVEAGATRVGLVREQAREILRGCEEERPGS